MQYSKLLSCFDEESDRIIEKIKNTIIELLSGERNQAITINEDGELDTFSPNEYIDAPELYGNEYCICVITNEKYPDMVFRGYETPESVVEHALKELENPQLKMDIEKAKTYSGPLMNALFDMYHVDCAEDLLKSFDC